MTQYQNNQLDGSLLGRIGEDLDTHIYLSWFSTYLKHGWNTRNILDTGNTALYKTIYANIFPFIIAVT